MDMISELPDESLIKILSFLPTKVAISTSILSKRWECLWLWLPKLEYDDTRYFRSRSERERLRSFIHRSLPLHKAPVLESLRLKFTDSYFSPNSINKCIVVAASQCVRELEISYSAYGKGLLILPTNKSLVILKIVGDILLKVPTNVCLPSVKTLQLQRVSYADEESFLQILSSCPLLEDLLVELSSSTNDLTNFTICVPSLQRLTLCISMASYVDGFVINTPSLVYFKLDDEISTGHYYMVENMPKLVEAYVHVVSHDDVQSFSGSITSVKRLTLCLRKSHSEDMYGDGFVFNQLEHLKLCACSQHSLNLLNWLLEDSPNVRILDLFMLKGHFGFIKCWNEPTMVPECVLSSLQILNWSWYLGSPAERDLAVYILKNARCLKTAAISSYDCIVPKLEMIKELELSSRASTTCQLIFD